MSATALAGIGSEIHAVHAFFVAWIGGRCPPAGEHFALLTARFDAAFTLTTPDGATTAGQDLWAGMRRAHGANPEFRIAIREVRPALLGRGYAWATYEEWQRGARLTGPERNGRIATALFAFDAAAPGGLRWLRVQETWLPPERVAGGDFDF